MEGYRLMLETRMDALSREANPHGDDTGEKFPLD
jgi:hypothetical protein